MLLLCTHNDSEPSRLLAHTQGRRRQGQIQDHSKVDALHFRSAEVQQFVEVLAITGRPSVFDVSVDRADGEYAFKPSVYQALLVVDLNLEWNISSSTEMDLKVP